MRYLRLAKKNRELDSESWSNLYENKIVKKIRARYSLNQELAILRQRDTKPTEYAAYTEYVEQCKAQVKAEMEIN